MEYTAIAGTGLKASRIALGTWAIGGWMWGGTEEDRSIQTIHAALDKGVTVVDTAPVYGFGASEEIVGKALEAYGGRDKILISTKVGLEWKDGRVFRNGSRERIMKEITDSLRRLRTDYIDIYYVHWPDPTRPVTETARAMRELYDQGTVKAVGVSNFTQSQMEQFQMECPLHLCQPPYNIFERAIESDIKPFCERTQVTVMAYGALCRGLLSGKMRKETTFSGDDLRKADPKFQEPRFSQYLEAVDRLDRLSHRSYGKDILAFSVRWVLEKGVPITIWGGRTPSQMEPIDAAMNWSMDLATLSSVDSILAECIKAPVGAEFMAPPTGLEG